MNSMMTTTAVMAVFLASTARAGQAAKMGPGAEAHAKAQELRLSVRRDKQALKKDWLDWRRELASLKMQETEARKAASLSNAPPEAKKAQLETVVKTYAAARAAVRARRGPARNALKEKLKADRSRRKNLSEAQ